MPQEYTVDHVVDTLKNAKVQEKKCTLLLGAGCSVEAGIPTANGFVEEIKRRFPAAYRDASPPTYPNCMAQLGPGERRDLVAEYVDNAKINWAHVAVSCLIGAGYVDRVLTTNFDPLIMRACAQHGIFPAVYDFAASQLFKPADIPGQAIFHLHGQRSGFVQLHTPEEIDEHSKRLEPLFQDAGRGRSWIVAGYSGDNDPVLDHLIRIPKFDYKLFWVCYRDNEPSKKVNAELLSIKLDNYALPVKGFDADSFFITLARKLGCFPPTLINDPFFFLVKSLDTLSDFPWDE